MKTLVIYDSKFGSTREYALQIGQHLKCDVREKDTVAINDLADFDLIILGACLLEAKVVSAKLYSEWVERYPDKIWAFYTVGLSNPALTDFDRLLSENFDPDILQELHLFHFRGVVRYKRLQLMDSMTSRVLEQKLSSIDETDLTDRDVELLSQYGTTIDQTEDDSFGALIDWVNDLQVRTPSGSEQ